MKFLPTIIYKSIPHNEHRYDTCGDYFSVGDQVHFRVSNTKPEYQLLVLIHELVEWFLITKKGIRIEDIDLFDKEFEKLRLSSYLIGDQEPGDMVSAPYHEEHQTATQIEKFIATKLGVDWNKYDKSINKL